MTVARERIDKLHKALEERILVLDGAIGTAIQARDLSADDFGGADYEGCNEYLCSTRPDVVEAIHKGYLEAGADIIETNSFGSTPLVMAEYGLAESAAEVTEKAARIARKAADALTTPDKPRFVAGSMGPTTKAISIAGGVTFGELVANYREQAAALVRGGVDYLLLETANDTRTVKAGIIGIEEAFDSSGTRCPIAVSATIETQGVMLAGQDIEAFVVSLEHVDLLYLGLNCATGPEFMTEHIRSLSTIARVPVACVPNAGMPDENLIYQETPERMAAVLGRFMDEGWLNLIGGCCGTTREHISAFASLVRHRPPRKVPFYSRTCFSGIEAVECTDENRPLLVGERTNVIGSRKFKKLIAAEKYEEASEIARKQVKSGSQVIDICLANPDRDELTDMERFLDFVVRKVKVPLMIDSTDAGVIERSLTYCQGKSIINSINLEDGEKRFEEVVPLGKKYGAAFVVGTIDDDPEQGMGVTRERKLEIARRAYDLLVNKYGIPPSDIIFDPLVFPCATGDEQYLGSATETIAGIRLIKEAFPETKTILGISNVSFGLPPAGREVLNSVFLYLCTQAGLDLAIVNSQKLERYASIPDDEKKLAEDILLRTSKEAVDVFAGHFREADSRIVRDKAAVPLDERLASYVIEGTKEGLDDDIVEAMKDMKPLDIINGPLMNGMNEVGRLFNDNQLIVAEVLQSAEVMKAAVSRLKPHMDRADGDSRATFLLATVKGDVHDIGKNLVDIILTNNGFDVINLGIKISPRILMQAIEEHSPDAIGLSGLLVKSAQEMVVTARDLKRAGYSIPLIVGGA